MKNFNLTLVTILLSVAVAQAESISQTIGRLNADAQKPGGPESVLKSISASTHVPIATLEKEKAKSQMSYGDLYIAHAIARASGKTFDQIAALKAKGETWDKIAADNNVSLGGKKVVKTNPAKPSPTPMKTLRQEQTERYNGTYEITNAPKPPKP